MRQNGTGGTNNTGMEQTREDMEGQARQEDMDGVKQNRKIHVEQNKTEMHGKRRFKK